MDLNGKGKVESHICFARVDLALARACSFNDLRFLDFMLADLESSSSRVRWGALDCAEFAERGSVDDPTGTIGFQIFMAGAEGDSATLRRIM